MRIQSALRRNRSLRYSIQFMEADPRGGVATPQPKNTRAEMAAELAGLSPRPRALAMSATAEAALGPRVSLPRREAGVPAGRRLALR